MIIDTSALVAVLRSESGFEALLDAMLERSGAIPAPVLVEFHRVMSAAGNVRHAGALALVEQLRGAGSMIEPFTPQDADIAAQANERFGTGNGRGGRLNMLDLMVYAVAQRTGRPILCTGKDFQTTEASIHPASRSW